MLKVIVAQLLCAIGVCLANPAIAKDEALRLAPDSNWTADFAEDFCALRRNFANDDHLVFFEMKQVVPGQGFEVTIASNTLDRENGRFRTAFLPDDNPVRQENYRRVETTDGWDGFIYSDSLDPEGAEPSATGSPEALARSSAITSYVIEGGFAADIVLETGPMNEVMNVMRQCTDGLVESWGLDPEEQRSLTRSVDYPEENRWMRSLWQAMGEPSQRINQFEALLLVDAGGRVTRCIPGIGTVDADRNEAGCAHLKDNAVFIPALDETGAPIDSYLSVNIAIVGS